MTEMQWEKTYKLWKGAEYSIGETLSVPVEVETIPVPYKQDGYFYGFDWLPCEEVPRRKELIRETPTEFFYFTKHTNKGTIQTAGMLAEAQTDEERAAIWIAATAKELIDHSSGGNISKYARQLYNSACNFLRDRYELWHHAMKQLVPQLAISWQLRESIVCEDAEPVVELICLNTFVVKNSYKILCYTSLEDGKNPGFEYRQLS